QLLSRGFWAAGLLRKPGLTLLVRSCRIPVRAGMAGVRIHRASTVDRATIVRIHAACFATPASRRSWNLAAAASRGHEHYLAFVGATPVGVGTLRVDGDRAWLGGGATRTRWRNRGAHQALI